MDLPLYQALSDAPALPDAETFGQLLAPGSARHRAIKQLYELTTRLPPPSAPLEARLIALGQLFSWVRATGKVPAVDGADPSDRPQVSRLRLLGQMLERVAPARQAIAALIGSVLADSNGLLLFARVGLPTERGFWAETTDRLSRRFLPEPVDEQDLARSVAKLLPAERDAVWLASVPAELSFAIVTELASSGRPWATLTAMVTDSMALLATRVSAIGLSDVIRLRSPQQKLADSPFFRLPRACDRLSTAVRSNADRSELAAAAASCRELTERCRIITAEVVSNLEHAGVSIDVVYRIELIGKTLDRIDALIATLAPESDVDRVTQAQRLLVSLLQARVRDRDLGEITRANLHLLARKIIERAGDTGEHYITSTRGEWVKMLLSAGGGGLLTAGTTAMKFFIGWAHFAPFVEGMLSATNYAGSFLLMQFLGFTLATKQPSMTAAALAGSMRESSGYTDLTGLVTTIARITRSQLAAAIGNLGVVIPSAYALDFAYRQYVGRHFLDPETAKYVLHSLHPTESGTIFYAALTGVLLWASSVGAGWLENWAVYRRLPDAIAEHPIHRFVGRRLTHWASRVFAHNISGVGGNTTLGLLLGMTPVLGKFFGLPLDVRHVTLSTGALTLAVCGLGAEATPHAVGAAAVGIAIIGVLNFGVSFVLALAVALRARQVERADRFKLFISVVITFCRSPLQFVLPPSAATVPAVHGPVSVRPARTH